MAKLNGLFSSPRHLSQVWAINFDCELFIKITGLLTNCLLGWILADLTFSYLLTAVLYSVGFYGHFQILITLL